MKRLALILGLTLSFTATATGQGCKVNFSVVWKDKLDNVRQGLSAADLKWFQKKLAKKYPGVCYSDPSPSVALMFFISEVPGTRVIDGTEYSRPTFNLSLERRDGDKFIVVHSFSQRDCAICHPQHDVIEDAVKWIHSGGMTDPKQGVVPSQYP
jgi:hypothetical protein